MSDTPAIDFENVPPIAQRSPHLPLLLALKDHPGKSARIAKDTKLDQADAAKLANTLKNAAAKIGNGFDVATRYLPAVDHYGVWVTYTPVEGDEVPTAEARSAAKSIIESAMTPAHRDAIAVMSVELLGPEDDDWEMPERVSP